MKTIEIQIDDQLLQCAQAVAESRHSTVQELLVEMLKLLTRPEVVNDPITGIFADEPEAMDEIMSSITERGWNQNQAPRG
ncbi:MAG: hypothetical protein HC769_06470 [Cyanobacteria bacterium CRU_2_1]|nr:hypothetical protein [Cyanobacteria bacterium CRU_2_1]NJR58525.1 hypothetical protein [Cyanobacteria bacterium CRU_2_1]